MLYKKSMLQLKEKNKTNFRTTKEIIIKSYMSEMVVLAKATAAGGTDMELHLNCWNLTPAQQLGT